jgi:hypothetical protein
MLISNQVVVEERLAPACDAEILAPIQYLYVLTGHMAPQIPSDAIVSCRRISRKQLAEIGSGVFVFEGEDFCLLRRIKEITSKGHFKLCCDNPDLEDNVTLRLSERWRVWQVLRIVDAPIE